MASRLRGVALPVILSITACGERHVPDNSPGDRSVPIDSLEISGADANSAAETAADAAEKVRQASHGDNVTEEQALPIVYKECRALRDALDAKRNQPNWFVTLVVKGKPIREGKKTGGGYYELVDGGWIKQAIDYLDIEHQKVIFYIDLTKQSSPMAPLQTTRVSNCFIGPPVELNGENFKVITYNIIKPSSQNSFQPVRKVAKMYVGMKDGLPHKIEYGAESDYYHAYTYTSVGQ